MNWLMFKDGDAAMLESWNKSATECLKKVSSEVAEVKLILPTADDAKFAYAKNLDLTGRFSISFTDGDTREFDIPLPYHGVFVARGAGAENKDAPQRLVWSSWLGEMPGLSMVKKHSGEKELHMGLPDGRFLIINEEKFSKANNLDDVAFIRWWARNIVKDVYDDDLVEILTKHEGILNEETSLETHQKTVKNRYSSLYALTSNVFVVIVCLYQIPNVQNYCEYGWNMKHQ